MNDGPGPHYEAISSKLRSWSVHWRFLRGGYAADVDISGSSERCVQFSGDFDGATLLVEGSNNGKDWFLLHDIQGVALSVKSDKLLTILESPRYIRPRVEGPGKSTNLECILVYH